MTTRRAVLSAGHRAKTLKSKKSPVALCDSDGIFRGRQSQGVATPRIVTLFLNSTCRKVLDTAELSLEDYRFPSKTGNDTGAGKHRHVIDAMRTTAWFHALRLMTGAKSTYEMERQLEPESFGVDESGTAYKRNKWRGYRLGRHTPRQSLVEAMERLHPGTQEVFDHVLWDALRSGTLLPRHLLLKRLRPNVGKIIASPRLLNQNGSLRSDAVERLECLGNFDGLASLVALLREAIAVGNVVHQQHLSLAWCRAAIAAAPFLHSHGIAGPLADYVNENLLRLVPAQQRYVLDARAYLQRADLIAGLVGVANEKSNRSYSYSEDVRFILEVLHGYRTEELEQLLAPCRFTQAS